MDRSHNKIKELDDQSNTYRPPDKVTIQELNKTMKQLKNNKAPGARQNPKRDIHKCQPNNQRNLSKRNQYNNSVIRHTRPMASGRNYKTLQGKGHKRKMLQ